MKHRLLSVLLCLCMLISLIPATPVVSAEGGLRVRSGGSVSPMGRVSECEHDYTVKVTPPTCSARGYTTYTCSKCGATYIGDEKDVLPHNYVGGYCTACGQRLLTVRFLCDDGVSVSACKTPDMDGPLEDNAQTAHPINVANGQIDCSGEGEVSFIVVLQPGYELESVSAVSADAYKNFKQPIETGVVNGYRLTKISDDVTVTVKVKQYNEHPDAFTVIFDCDEGVSVTTYEDQTRAGAYEERATRAIARSGLTGAPDVSGKGQVNFLVVISPDYTFEGVTLTPVTAFRTVRFPNMLDIENGFRIVDITGDITVKVSAVKNGPQECRHDYVPKVTPPTCTEAGFTTYTCSKCGDSYVTDKTEPTGHDFCDQGFCTRCGMLAYKIKFVCDPGVSVSVSRTLAAGGQIDEDVTVAYPRDYASGLIVMDGTGQVSFTVNVENGYRLESVSPTPAEHFRTFRPPAQQLLTGSYRLTLINGDITVTVRTSVIDPSTCTHDYQAVVTEPTCTAEGYTTYTCPICGDSYRDDHTPRIAHEYMDGVCAVCGEKRINVRIVCGEGASVTVFETQSTDGPHADNATSAHPRNGDTGLEDGSGEGQVNFAVRLAEGYRLDSVSAEPASAYQKLKSPADKAVENCYRVTRVTGDFTITVKAVKAGPAPCEHDYRAAVTAPTCMEVGYTTYTCAKCGDSYTSDEVPALGHDYRSAVTKPTCTEEGYTTHTCARCGDEYIDSERAPLGHIYRMVVMEPTCTEPGYTTHTCTRCGDKYTDAETDALGHDFRITVTLPTCTEPGYTTHACKRCGERYTDNETPALGHDYQAAVTEPTCTARGYTTYTCSHCGDHYLDDETPALGHEYQTVVTEPTCTAKGYTTNTCMRCGHEYVSNWTAPLDHDFRIEVFAPTCTDKGYTSYACRRCRYGYAANETAALGHDYRAEVTEPTCTTKGYTTYTCTRCGDSYVGSETPALGHNYKVVVKEPTCTEKGYTTFTCRRCSDSYVGNETAALRHDYEAEVKAPTCTEKGSTTYTCRRCGDQYVTDESAALGHDYQAVVTPPTCTAPGYTTYTCSRCGDRYTGSETGALGHDWGEGTVTKQPTETVRGERTYTCARCGEQRTEPIPALNHVHKFTAAVIEPTCTEPGYTTHSCTCGESYMDSEVPALGHQSTAEVIAPTCTEKGCTAYTCARCGAVYADNETAALGHDYRAAVTAPTCTKKGYTTYTCARCGDRYTGSETAALGHEYESEVTVPNCTEKGYTTYTCARCGDRYIGNETAALGHDYEAEATAPTCTEKGYTSYTCARCGDRYTGNETAALGHVYDAVATAPTCEKPGYITYTCARCGDSFVGNETPALGHDFKAAVTAPTCTENGYTTYTCARCGNSYLDDETAALGHDYDAVVTAPTCTENGYTTYTCVRCGESCVGDETDALGHEWGEGVVTLQPTQEEPGERTFTCSRCGEKKTKMIPELSHVHSYTAVVTAPTCIEPGCTTYTCACGESYADAEVPALGHDWQSVVTAPTCTEAGFTTDTCARCGETRTRDEVEALGHDYIGVVTAPTCTEEGYTTYTCIRCGDSYRADENDALGHDYRWSVTEPTCTEKGFTTRTCLRCGKSEQTEEVAALGHAFRDGVCIRCGEVESDYVPSVSYDALNRTIENAEKIVLKSFTSQSVAAFSRALEAARDARTAGKQADVDAAQEALEAAVEALEENPSDPFRFDDVTNEGQYYYEPVYWAVENEITNGATPTTFNPGAGCTRAQVVTFLWRAAGKPEPKSDISPFLDVEDDRYYMKAVLWAMEKDITNGTGDGKFSPDATCTRGQIVTFLWRYFEQIEPENGNNPFDDVKDGQYYTKAILWAVEDEITKGTSADKFSPNATCTRAQIVTFLYRALAEEESK